MAIGFEFATNIGVGPANAGDHFDKSARLSRGSGWTMVVDGDDVEFVVAQVEETDTGRSMLEHTLDMVVKFIGKLQIEFAKKHGAVRTLSKAELPSDLFPNAPDFVLTYKGGGAAVGCIPQVTAGIRLGRLRKLFRVMSDPTSAAAEQYLGGSSAAAKDFYTKRIGKAAFDFRSVVDPSWPAHVMSPKLRGLLSLISLYLLQGNAQNSVGAVKYLTFIMSRTSFSALFNELPTDERDHYRGNKNDWVSLICSTLMLQVGGVAFDPKMQVIGQKVTDRLNLPSNKAISIPTTRRDWLRAMTQGQDLLSEAATPIEGPKAKSKYIAIYKDSNPGLGHRLRGLAALGDKMDDIQYGASTERSAILEFRARQKELALPTWKQYALDSFDFFRTINEGSRHSAVDLGD